MSSVFLGLFLPVVFGQLVEAVVFLELIALNCQRLSLSDGDSRRLRLKIEINFISIAIVQSLAAWFLLLAVPAAKPQHQGVL